MGEEILETKQFDGLPPFTRALLTAAREGSSFATPGHHGGAWQRETRAGRIFAETLGSGIFAADISDSDSRIGDVSAHEGASGAAEALAARVFGAEKTLFVLGGTSAANRICLSALLAPGDLVLMERSHHKSVYQGALTEAGATPVYVPMLTNAAGTLGGAVPQFFSEKDLRRLVGNISPEKAKKKRPFRLACVQLVTYDGVFVSAKKILETVGSLCDYILFDAAWAGYEIFIPFLKALSPLTASLGENAPGILVTQSVHKQLAGFTQTSQIHVRDAHLKGKKRRLSPDVLQESFLRHSSTSANALLFAGLEMNAAMLAEAGEALWTETVRRGILLRKKMCETLSLMHPWQPETADGVPWESGETQEIATERRFWEIRSGEAWHGFDALPRETYFLDPCKILLRTAPSGISGLVLSAFLQERGIVAEKANFDSVLFLLTPADSDEKYEKLLTALVEFETAYEKGVPVGEAIHFLAASSYARQTIRELCAAQFCFLKERDFGRWQRESLTALPVQKLTGRDASDAFVSGKGEKAVLAEAVSRVALEAADAYPPGICIVPPGAVWTKEAVRYFRILEDFGRAFPEFAPELHGVHEDGVWVL